MYQKIIVNTRRPHPPVGCIVSARPYWSRSFPSLVYPLTPALKFNQKLSGGNACYQSLVYQKFEVYTVQSQRMLSFACLPEVWSLIGNCPESTRVISLFTRSLKFNQQLSGVNACYQPFVYQKFEVYTVQSQRMLSFACLPEVWSLISNCLESTRVISRLFTRSLKFILSRVNACYHLLVHQKFEV